VTAADWVQYDDHIHVPVDQVLVGAIDDAPRIIFQDDAPGDPVSAYYACLKSLCNTTGGTWVDDDPNRPAGCYFRTKVEATGYALTVWTCLPGGILEWIFA
jgi:hypothetical protein